MKRAPFLLVMLLMLVGIMPVGIVKAAEFIVTVPNGLVEEGAKWNGWYRNNGENRPENYTKERYFLECCVFNPSLKWALDFLIVTMTWGKVKSFEASGIKVRVADGS